MGAYIGLLVVMVLVSASLLRQNRYRPKRYPFACRLADLNQPGDQVNPVTKTRRRLERDLLDAQIRGATKVKKPKATKAEKEAQALHRAQSAHGTVKALHDMLPPKVLKSLAKSTHTEQYTSSLQTFPRRNPAIDDAIKAGDRYWRLGRRGAPFSALPPLQCDARLRRTCRRVPGPGVLSPGPGRKFAAWGAGTAAGGPEASLLEDTPAARRVARRPSPFPPPAHANSDISRGREESAASWRLAD